MVEVALEGQDKQYYIAFEKRLALRMQIQEQLEQGRIADYEDNWLRNALDPTFAGLIFDFTPNCEWLE